MTTRVDSQRLRHHIDMIVGERSPFSGQRHLAGVEKFIEREFASCGLDVESDYFPYGGGKFRNIIARRRPKKDVPVIVLGAHFDSVPGSPGADDASGVAVLLEAARLLSQIERLRSQILFCAFNLEELNMIGSAALAKKLKAAGAKVEAMISLEMVGYTDPRPGRQKYPVGLSWMYPDRGDFIGVIGNWSSNILLRRFADSMRQVYGLMIRNPFRTR